MHGICHGNPTSIKSYIVFVFQRLHTSASVETNLNDMLLAQCSTEDLTAETNNKKNKDEEINSTDEKIKKVGGASSHSTCFIEHVHYTSVSCNNDLSRQLFKE